ncbi:MAG: response regulator [Ruminococcus sp.]|nr:response regulator [Ruminococcus sp.]
MSRILVIDDDAMILKMAGFLLKKQGHEAVTAANGSDGAAIAAGENPQMAFIDVEMPGKNGFETLADIKRACPSMPVFMMTGTLDDEVRRKAAELGALGCINKPLQAPQVIGALQKAGV